ncbi:interleukin-10 receptor subunit beta-like isoform 2-T2 [Discoglossus pictus]
MRTESFLTAVLGLMHWVQADTSTTLPAPKNVRINSYNLKHVLKWDPVIVKDDSHLVTYTVEAYRGDFSLNLCVNIFETHCDFTIGSYWRVILRVRAEMGTQKSGWVETPKFEPIKNTVIGPVESVKLISKQEQNLLYVQFEPHVLSPNYSHFEYNITYWKEGSNEKTLDWTLTTFQPIRNLEAGTVYCVEVTPMTNSIIGQVSDPVCERTADPALGTVGHIVLVLCIIGVCCTALGCSFLAYKQHAVIKHWLYPPFRIPHHIEQYLLEPPSNTCVAGPKTDCVLEFQCDSISIVEFPSSNIDPQTCPEDDSQSAAKT